MVKRILILIFVAFVTITGYISLRKLNYWDRSVMIFKIDSSQQSFQGRGRRGSGEFDTREGRPGLPEFREGIQRPGQRNMRDTTFAARGEFGDRRRGGEMDRGRDFRRGSTVNLNLVVYYLAVFAFFTLLVVYGEKFYRLIFRKKT